MIEKIKFSKDEMKQNKMVQKLKTSELKYRVLVENLPQKIFLKDSNSVYISCNNNFAKDLKIEADDIAGKTDYDFFPKNLADKYRADDKRILKSGETEEINEEYIQGGKKVFVHTVKTPIEDENGNNIGILGIFWDVTERRIAEQKIKESEKKFRTLTKNIPGMIYRAKPDWSTEIITGSEAICGYSTEEFNSHEINWLDIIHSDDKEDVLNESSKMLSITMELKQEYQIITKDGSPRWVEDHKISLFHEDGSFRGIDGVVYDITNRKEMEQKLRESEEWLSTMLKSIGDGVIAIDIKGIIIFLNPIAESLTGWKQENAIGQHINNVFRIINEFKHNSVENPALKALQEDTVNGLSRYTILISKDKREIFIDDTGAPIKDKDGNIIGAVLIFKDITERRIAEKRLKESEHNLVERVKELTCLYGLSTLVENPDITIDGIIHETLEFIPPAWKFSNKTCARIVYGNKEFKTNNFKETEWRLSNRTTIGEKNLRIEVYYLENRPFIEEEKDLINEIGNRLKTIIEQKEAGQRINQAHSELYQIFTASIPMYVTDLDYSTIKVNERFCNHFQLKKTEIIGKKCYDIWKGNLCHTPECSLKQILSGKEQYEYEIKKELDDGKLIYCIVKNYPFYGQKGELMGIIKSFTDISERKKAEALRKKFSLELEKEVDLRTKELKVALDHQKLYLDQILKASQFKTEFMATMSHELRTPLNAIIGFTDLILEGVYGKLNSEQLEYIKDIEESSKHLLNMITHILDISKIESGQVTVTIDKIQLSNIIEQVISTLKPLFSKKNLKVEIRGLRKKQIIYADSLKLKQIIYNLLSNAIKFTERGIVSIEFLDKKDYWEFYVKDTGIGIAEKDYDIIFKDFKRVRSPYVDSMPGSGLGLSLTKRIIQLHGGEISFTSKIGKGTTFSFYIPKKIKNIDSRLRVESLLKCI